MMICPECEHMLNTDGASVCDSCNWSVEQVDGISVYLSSIDKDSTTFKQYIQNYDIISEHDLDQDVLDKKYVIYQAENLYDSISNVSGAEVCDLGCGQGVLSRMLINGGAASVTAIDISLPYLKQFKNSENISPVLSNAENLPFVDEFDIVVSTDVMEHVLNLGSYLFSLNRAMKHGGKVYIRVPYNENLLQYSPHFGCPYQFVHLRAFNRTLMRETMKHAGFCVQQTKLDGFVLGTPQAFWMKSQKRMSFYERFKKLAMSVSPDEHAVTKWNSGVAKLFMRPLEMVVVAEKVKSLEKIEGGGFVLT